MSTSKSEIETFYIQSKKINGLLGLESLPEQIVDKVRNKTYVFNLLCIGETGIGKSTLMDSLFKTSFDSKQSTHNPNSVNLDINTYDLFEGCVHLRLTIVETSGFNDQINMKDNYNIIVEYVNEQFDKYLNEERRLKRGLLPLPDTRIHACLYFLNPNGYGLKNIDISCMKALHNKVNIIPIIAKADALGFHNRMKLKSLIMKDIKHLKIEIYKFPTDDENIANINKEMNKHIPFAVVGSNDFIEVNGEKVRARIYSWGIVEVENEMHNDFVKLREMLIRTNMEDLCRKTHDVFYQAFRQEDSELTKKIKAALEQKYFMYEKEEKALRREFKKLREEINEFSKIKVNFGII